jgi:hypothetical protein
MPKNFKQSIMAKFTGTKSVTKRMNTPKKTHATAAGQLISNTNFILASPHLPVAPKKQPTAEKQPITTPAKPTKHPKPPKKTSKRSRTRALRKNTTEIKEIHRVEKKEYIAGSLKRVEANARARSDELYSMESQSLELENMKKEPVEGMLK